MIDAPDLAALRQRFPDAPHARLTVGDGGLPCVDVTAPTATGRVYLHGAHVASWAPAGQQPVLWLSGSSWFDPAKPIRGGVPICFPWFGPHPSDPDQPAHGTARVQPWSLSRVAPTADGEVVVELTTRIRPFALTYTATLGRSLTLSLHVENDADTSQRFEAALHTYFAVGDARRVSITGLEHTDYLDKTDDARRKNQGEAPVTFTAETDRAYLATTATCVLADPVLRRRVTIEKSGSEATVVWNPWVAKAARMPDFGDDEWPGMCCIETAAVGDHAITLAPGADHALTAAISVAAM